MLNGFAKGETEIFVNKRRMSELYQKYLKLKEKDATMVYLFKNGRWYIFLGADAKLMSNELGLKLTKFSSVSDKCGFPESELNKYLKFIKLLNIEYKIILKPADYIVKDLLKLNEISKEEAFTKIKYYQE